jgi:hypothetical protein
MRLTHFAARRWLPCMLLLLVGCARTGVNAPETTASRPPTVAERAPTAKPEPKQAYIETLDKRFIHEPYHVYYTDEGDSAFGKTAAEADNLARAMTRQLRRGQSFFEKELGLDFVLKQPRYRDVANIDVRMSYMPSFAMGNAGSGRIQVNRNPHFFEPDAPAPKSLRLSISTRWRPGNLTPEHEVFHLFQYGYGFFANLWYLEGLASAFGPTFDDLRGNVYDTSPLPDSVPKLQALLDLDKPGEASRFWRRVMGRCEPGCPAQWQGDRYAVPDVKMCGKRLVGSFMKGLPRAEQTAIAHRGPGYDPWAPYQMPPRGVRRPTERGRYENNYWLLRSLADATRQECRSGHPELTAFQALLNEVLSGNEDTFTRRMGKPPYHEVLSGNTTASSTSTTPGKPNEQQ